uniref:Uncharacterized protein n=1 Tax=Nelumbo nucifera TaxID=4432 RepID=A0A822YUP4_NELNU|nr:TPA_asm: hypothetical protein HUJ06_007043 [Nelumbo nucifera]DAD36403.1 TPA_asm: hypothetical protein HUJ06_007044 [Nelumbo nucifera]
MASKVVRATKLRQLDFSSGDDPDIVLSHPESHLLSRCNRIKSKNSDGRSSTTRRGRWKRGLQGGKPWLQWIGRRQDYNLAPGSYRLCFRDLATPAYNYISRKTKALYHWLSGEVVDQTTTQNEVMLVDPYFSIPVVVPVTTAASHI